MNLDVNVVFEHLVDSKAKIVCEQGGTRSGKTYNILMWIMFYYCPKNTDKIITICRKSYPALRASVMRDFFSILNAHQKYDESKHNKSNSEYHLFGNLVEFISLDQPQKVRGRKRDLLFINEANDLIWEDWQQLIFRTQERIIIDFNPSDEYHWIYDKVITRNDCDFFKTTFNDNPFLEDSIKEEILRLKSTDEQYWQIYGLGERSTSISTIFKYVETDQIPTTANLISYGMDFGYSNDPTTLVSVYIEDFNLYVREHLYRTQMTTNDIHQFLLDQHLENKPIYADSAEPRLIDELKRMGHTIFPSIKGKDSINAGIDLLKRYKINILSTSTNAIQEFRNYKWQEDKTGRLINSAVDKNNHIIDPCRYATYSILSKPNFGKYAVS